MQNREITIQLQTLSSLINRTYEACGGNLELQAEWARYLCVLAGGLLENAIKEFYVDFANRNTAKPLANYISSTLSPIRSPKSLRFLEVAGAFDPGWKDELQNYDIATGGLDAIDSIMLNRHLIAHGKSRQSKISLANLKDYLTKSTGVLDLIDQQCNR